MLEISERKSPFHPLLAKVERGGFVAIVLSYKKEVRV
jgi:hypothetical protein